MTTTLIDNIGLLVTHDEERPERHDAALLIEDGFVAWVGESRAAPAADARVDAEGAQRIEIEILDVCRRGFQDDLVLVVLVDPVRIVAIAAVGWPSAGLHIGGAPWLRAN